jgi:hypothetical protein
MKKLIIIAIILVLIILILLFVFSQRQTPVVNNQSPITNQPVVNNQSLGTNQGQELTAEQKAELEKKELIVKARNFIERYGSFSSDAQFANLYELKDEMTNRFWQETEKSIANQQLKNSKEFYSIGTKVLNVIEKISLNDSTTYSISTQRKEIKNIIEKILYQSAELKMIKQNNNWLVDSIKWQ